MEGGQDGTHGAYAQWDVGAELKYVHDPALIPHPPLVEQIASEIDDRSNHAMSNRAKVKLYFYSPWVNDVYYFIQERAASVKDKNLANGMSRLWVISIALSGAFNHEIFTG